MNKKTFENLSKFMTKILRHTPHEFGILLDEEGYCELNDLLIAISAQDFWKDISEEDLKEVVKQCQKKRFSLVGTKIRANYGHSYKKIPYKEGNPPDVLIHGTHTGVIEPIFNEGLKKMDREYVHMSEGDHFASLAGSRRGKLVLLNIDTKAARENKIKFYDAKNGVWLADYIPPEFLSIRSEKDE